MDFRIDLLVPVEPDSFNETRRIDGIHQGDREGSEQISKLMKRVRGIYFDYFWVGDEVLELSILVELLQKRVDVASGAEILQSRVLFCFENNAVVVLFGMKVFGILNQHS